MKLSQRQKSEKIQEDMIILFKCDQEVRLKKEFKTQNAGCSLQGYVNSIRLDRNGVWYEVIYVCEVEGLVKSTHLLDTFLEKVGEAE